MRETGSDPLHLPCQDSASPLLPFEDHAFALSLMLQADGFSSRLLNAFEAGTWLTLAAGLRGVSIVTEGLDDQDMYCRNEYERTRGVIASGIATELTRTLFVWGAIDLVMEVATADVHSKESSPRQLSRLVDGGSRSLLHQECVARGLLAALEGHGSESYAKSAAKARKFDAPLVAQGTFAAYQVRNVLVHGDVEWPDDYEESIVRSARIGRLACHVLIFAVQKVMLRVVDSDAETVAWCEESASFRERRIKDLLPSVHLSAALT